MGVVERGNPLVIVSHPTGNANVSAVVDALYEDNLLEAFFTCILWRPRSFSARFIPAGLQAVLERRARVDVPSRFVRTRPMRELVRSLMIRAGKKHLIASADNPFSIDAVYQDLDRHIARSLGDFPKAKAVYAYEDGALMQFRQAHKSGLQCVYDLPIGYWRANRQMSAEEAELQPGWKGTLNALADSDEKCARKDEELSFADIVMVPSTFVKGTLGLYPTPKRVMVNPFGVPLNIAAPRSITSRDEPLRVLYVGSLTQRKGIAYLFDAVEKAGKAVSLTVIGRKVGQSELRDRFCSKHRWLPSLPHGEILAEMRRHDVFVFPSLFEGLALVIGEALSQGLPVITTPNSGGPDILRDEADGFIVPIRDAWAITQRLLELESDRALLKQMSDAALMSASQLSWQGYKDRLLSAVRQVID